MKRLRIAYTVVLSLVRPLIWLVCILRAHLDVRPLLLVCQVAEVLPLLLRRLVFPEVRPTNRNLRLAGQLWVVKILKRTFALFLCPDADLTFHELAECTSTQLLGLLFAFPARLSFVCER